MQALMKLCARIVVLHHGERIAEGTPEQIGSDPRVLSVYFGGGMSLARPPEEARAAGRRPKARR
jgi:ABC-type lipopolysaccharide export system ATPase subunit